LTKLGGSAVFLFMALCVRSREWLKFCLEFAQVNTVLWHVDCLD